MTHENARAADLPRAGGLREEGFGIQGEGREQSPGPGKPGSGNAHHADPGSDAGATARAIEACTRGGIADSAAAIGAARDWLPDWRGASAVLIGSGPSAAQADIGAARGKAKVVCVNESWRLAPWADALYACDGIWWNKNRGVPKFHGLKISVDIAACRNFPDVRRVICRRNCDDILTGVPGMIGWGGNGGFQALNFTVQCSPRVIALVGFDMRIDNGLHWHGRHGEGLNNPKESNLAHWRRAFDGAAAQIAALGIRVVNCSPVSALTAYPKMSFEEALSL